MTTYYEVLVHPNKEEEEPKTLELHPEDGPKAFKDSNFVKWFLKFDSEVIMPLFVRNYSKYRSE